MNQQQDPIFGDYVSKIGTNLAIAHENGTLTDEALLKMTDDELAQRAFATVRTNEYQGKTWKDYDGIRTENYRAPHDRKKAEAQGRNANEIYSAPCRAFILFKKRKEAAEEIARNAPRTEPPVPFEPPAGLFKAKVEKKPCTICGEPMPTGCDRFCSGVCMQEQERRDKADELEKAGGLDAISI